MSYARFFAQFNQVKGTIGVSDHHELIHDFTRGRTDSLKALSTKEMEELNNHLKRYLTDVKRVKKAESADVMRKKIISKFRTCGYEKDGVANMRRIYAVVLKYGYLKKPMNSYSARELPKLVSQFERMESKFLAKFEANDQA